MKNKPWQSLINVESYNGTWDFFHYDEREIVTLVIWRNDEVKDTIEMNYNEFQELSQLIMQLNAKTE